MVMGRVFRREIGRKKGGVCTRFSGRLKRSVLLRRQEPRSERGTGRLPAQEHVAISLKDLVG
ncbi:MAG: hypothetical protein CMN64_03555 [Sphingobium sp.]|nr:hypothetical protein [Sphingobium sp.]